MNSNQVDVIQPKTSSHRIEFLDILRGIAVLFIYVANIGFFSGHWFFSKKARISSTILPTDDLLDFMNYTFVDGKFYTIFSLLFGIGCVVQNNNLKSNNIPFAPFFKKRMFWLLIFGLLHLCFLWAGDILTLYALLGFVLIWFIDFKDKKLLTWAAVLILMPILSWLIIHALGYNYPDVFRHWAVKYWEYFGFPVEEWGGVKFPNMHYLFQNESWATFFTINPSNSLLRINHILEEGRIFKVLGIFLIGLVVGRHILNNNLLNNLPLLKKTAFWGVGIGLPICLFRTYIEFFLKSTSDFWSLMHTITYAFGTVPLALGYCCILALMFHKKVRFIFLFAPVGRMAFSNYILQTLISILIFYGIGFKLAGKLGFSYIMGICLIIFALQILFSTWWLKKFRFGPLEWLWRSLTYGEKQSFRIHS